MRASTPRLFALGLLAPCFVFGCSLDGHEAAPISEPPRVLGECGTTENLFQGLFQLSREGGLDDLRTIITRHSVTGPSGREPDLAIRNVLGAALRIITRLGIRATREATIALGKGPVAESIANMVEEVLRFLNGELDGEKRFEATKAAGFYLRRCDAEPVLTLAERGLRLRRVGPDGKEERWLAALLREAAALLADPALDQFLLEFEEGGERGRAAFIGLLNQVLGFLADEDFDVARVRALFESSVFPLVEPSLAAAIDRLLALLEEAIRSDASIQASVREVAACALVDVEARQALSGFAYDLVASDVLPLVDRLGEASGLVADEARAAFLDHLATLFVAISEEREARQDIFVLLAVMLEPPEVERALPLLIELLERDLVSELMFGVTTLLAGCQSVEGE